MTQNPPPPEWSNDPPEWSNDPSKSSSNDPSGTPETPPPQPGTPPNYPEGGQYPGQSPQPGPSNAGGVPESGQPGSYPPGNYPQGNYPPGSYPPGSYPPGSYPQGGYPQGGNPPGTPQGGYGQPAYPGQSGMARTGDDRTQLFGWLGIVLGFLCCAIIGIVLGALSIRDAKRFNNSTVLGWVAIVVSVLNAIGWSIFNWSR